MKEIIMSDLKLNSDLLSDDDDDHNLADATDVELQQERAHARDYVCAEITRYAVDILEFYNNKLGKNESLALTIECLSESLGNLISLAHEDCHTEVLDSSMEVIRQGISNQQEVIAELTYGQVGHA